MRLPVIAVATAVAAADGSGSGGSCDPYRLYAAVLSPSAVLRAVLR